MLSTQSHPKPYPVEPHSKSIRNTQGIRGLEEEMLGLVVRHLIKPGFESHAPKVRGRKINAPFGLDKMLSKLLCPILHTYIDYSGITIILNL